MTSKDLLIFSIIIEVDLLMCLVVNKQKPLYRFVVFPIQLRIAFLKGCLVMLRSSFNILFQLQVQDPRLNPIHPLRHYPFPQSLILDYSLAFSLKAHSKIRSNRQAPQERGLSIF